MEQSVNDFNAPGNNLYEMIRNLLANESKLLKLIENIRILGNMAPHGNQLDQNPSEKDVLDLLSFIEHFLEAIYIMPSKISDLKSRRQN